MLSLDDPLWQQLNGGYHTSYDPSPALKRLMAGEDAAPVFAELWGKLVHQGDVDTASYAVVPELVGIQRQRGDLGWNLYALAATIEIERRRKRNPPLPDWLRDDYARAWRDLLAPALGALARSDDRLLIRAALATVAIAKGELKRGALIIELDDSEIDELVEGRLAWSEQYDDSVP